MATMRAAVLQKDRTLTIEPVSLPQLKPGAAIVQVLAVQVVNFAADVISGNGAAFAYPGSHIQLVQSLIETGICRSTQVPTR